MLVSPQTICDPDVVDRRPPQADLRASIRPNTRTNPLLDCSSRAPGFKNAYPDPVTGVPPTSNVDNTPSNPSLPDNTLRAEYRLTEPVPAATRPASGMNSAVTCNATLTWRGVAPGVDCSN